MLLRAVERALARLWWQPRISLGARLLQPLALLYASLAARRQPQAAARAEPAPVPVLVVGNLVVGGAGKTPVVIALVRALQAAGRRPGVISRGHGRSGAMPMEVGAHSGVAQAGDEPLLIHRRTGVPVAVASRRLDAARLLCSAHPELDVLVSDDGLQHHALARQAQLIVFDDRGAGNGLLLPAGPLREPLPDRLPPRTLVAYTGERAASTPLPGTALRRTASLALPLQAWNAASQARAAGAAAVPLESLRAQRFTALAGIAAPAQFFAMLRSHGLVLDELAQPDHARYRKAPWPAGTAAVITTEKDAVKLAELPDVKHAAMSGATAVWVVPLDCELPPSLVQPLLQWTAAR